jgi:hypothetical protein
MFKPDRSFFLLTLLLLS